MLKSLHLTLTLIVLFFFQHPLFAEKSIDSTNYYIQVCDSFEKKTDHFQADAEMLQNAINWFDHVTNITQSTRTHVLLGNYLYNHNQNDSACNQYKIAINTLIRVKKTDKIAVIYNKFATCEYYSSNFSSSKHLFSAGIKYPKSKGLEATLFTGLAMSYEGLDQFDSALIAYSTALDIYQDVNDSLGIAYSYINIGSLYIQHDELLPEAKNYLIKAYKYLTIKDDKPGLAAAINNLAIFYNKSKEYNKALASYKEVFKIDSAMGNLQGLSGDLNNIGLEYSNLKDTINAYNTLSEALRIAESIHSKQMIAYSAYNLGELFLNLDSLDKAIIIVQKSLKAGTESENKTDQISALELLSKIYSKTGNYKKAYQYLNQYFSLYDSTFSIEKAQLLANAKEKFEAVQKQNTILSLEQKSLKDANIRMILFVSITIVSLILIFIFIAYIILRRNRKIIEKQEHYFSKLLSNSIEYTFVIDKDKILKYVSPSYTKVFWGEVGDYIEESLFKSMSDKGIENRKSLFKSMLEGRESVPFDYWVKDKHGKKRFVTGVAQNFFKDKVIEGVIVNLWDITSLKETSQSLKTREKELENSNKTKEKLFSIISHDLVGHIGTSSELMKLLNEDYKNLDEQVARKIITTVSDSLETTNTRVINLLSWARIQMKNIQTHRKTVLLFQALEKSVDIFKSQLTDKSITLHTDCDKTIKVNADPYQLEIILRNLIRNAIKFTHEGGNIWIDIDYNSLFVNLCIKDDGIGMDEKLVKQILSNSTVLNSNVGTNKEQGTGLGMLIVKEFIHLNKGKIKITSQLGKGTSVCIILLS